MNENKQEKKQFKIKIAGFTFGLGHIIAVVAIVVIIAVVSMVSSAKQQAEIDAEVERARQEREAAIAAAQQGNATNTTPVFDIHSQIQESLVKQYGIPPEGFEWGYDGSLVALGDADHTCEDVVYMFLRSLSILDFSTAERYSTDSAVIKAYQTYYGFVSDAMTNYYNNFLRKQFKVSITSLEVLGISDIAVFADGTEYLTITVSIMDLTDKDFWVSDRDTLFAQMRVYRETESDSTKMEQYVYEYLYDKYVDGSVSKRDRTIELVVTKQNGGGWLVSGDRELCAYLQYENGVDVARYILKEFESWYMDVTLKEQLEAVYGTQSPSMDEE